jgi:thioredoxin-like negative regulator of GroEL
MKEVLKFSANWCGPCEMLSKTIAGLKDNTVPIREIDIDEELDMSASYNIRSVPTLIMLEDGSEVKRIIGSVSSSQLKEFLNG